MKNLDRREFLRLAGLLTASAITPSIQLKPSAPAQNPDAPNILIFVFDTFSAKHLSFQGYSRQTTPKLARMLERATVFHNHYSGDNFTTPGTASLLTGTYPWSHRAIKLSNKVAPEFENKNTFSLFESYFRVAYTHNPLVEVFLDQFNQDITFHKLREELLLSTTGWIDRFFKRDFDTASLSWNRTVNFEIDGLVYSLLFSEVINKELNKIPPEVEQLFPRGVPEALGPGSTFQLEHTIDWIQNIASDFSPPLLGYFHMLPPHDPYRTRRDFVDRFLDDGLTLPEKEFHHITPKSQLEWSALLENRRLYDEYILYVDAEFARLYDSMEREGVLENTWVIFTSDHGEMFERGFNGHSSPHMYQPVVQIPLVIFEPGKRARTDIYTPTSCVDVLPTLLHLSGQPIPDWVEGEILPPYSNEEAVNRKVYGYHGKMNPDQYGELVNGTMMMVGNQYKVLRYFGYSDAYDYPIEMKADPWYEVYDILNDPEELENLAISQPARVNHLVDELEEKYWEIKGPYKG